MFSPPTRHMVVNGATKHDDMAHFDAEMKKARGRGPVIGHVMNHVTCSPLPPPTTPPPRRHTRRGSGRMCVSITSATGT